MTKEACFLIGEVVKGLEMKSKQVLRVHYAYQKNGSCSLLMTIEPKTDKQIADVFAQRTKREFALHLRENSQTISQRGKDSDIG
jgi:hypothetical protein